MDLRQLTQDFVEYLFGMWRFRWLALAAAWVLALGGWYWALSLPDEYDAEAQVYVDTRTILLPLLGGLTVQTDTISQVRLVTQILLSRPQLESVAVDTGMDARIANPRELEALLDSLRRRIQINQVPRSEIFRISFRDSDPAMARDVVQSLLESFMERSLSKDRTDSAQAQRFLEQQIKAYEARLTEAEERVAEFKKANMGLMPGQGGDYFSRLQEAENQVRAVEAQIDAVSERRRELMRQMDGEAPVFGIAGNAGMSAVPTSYDADIGRLEQTLQTLRIQYTDRHPEVLRVQATLDNLYEAREEERMRLAPSGTSSMTSELDLNPVYQQLRVSLSNTEVELATLRAALRERQSAVQYLYQMVDTIPEVEAQLYRLNRDYSVVQRQYDALVQRLESARLSEEVQVDTEGVTFEVIDPPRMPLAPSGPNRPLLITGVLLVALAVGTGLAFLLSQHSPVFFSGSRLAHKTGLPVFGMLSAANGYRTEYRIGVVFLAALGGLVVFSFALTAGLDELLRGALPLF